MKKIFHRLLGCDDTKLRRKARLYGKICIACAVFFFVLAIAVHFIIKQSEEEQIFGTQRTIFLLETAPELRDIDSQPIEQAIAVLKVHLDGIQTRPETTTHFTICFGVLLLYMGILLLKLHELLNKIPNQNMEPTVKTPVE